MPELPSAVPVEYPDEPDRVSDPELDDPELDVPELDDPVPDPAYPDEGGV